MAFKIKDGVNIGTTNVFNSSGVLQVNAPTATKWVTARDLSLTGDATATLASVDGNANVSAALTLATVNSNVGSFGTTTAIPVITVNAKGLITAVSTASISTTLNTAGSSGTGSVALASQTLTIAGGTGVTSSASGQTITLSIGQAVATNSNVTFNDINAGGNVTITGNLTVNGTTTTINSTVVSVDDITFELGAVASPTDVTAAGGGIVLKGATDKSITWGSTNGWTSTEDLNVASGKIYRINGTSVLSATTLGSGVTGSSLTSVGTIATGTWQGTLISPTYGGTGVNNGSNTLTMAGSVTHAGAFNQTFTATATTSLTLPTTGTLATLAGTETFTNKTLTSPTLTTPTINGGTHTGITSLGIRDTSAAFDVTLAAVSSTALTAGRTLTIDVINAARSIKLAGNIDLAANFTTSGANALTLTTTGSTNVTLPTTGTLATLAGTETLINKTLQSYTLQTSSATNIANRSVAQSSVSTTSVTAVDTWAIATYRAVKYLVQVTQGTNYQISEILVIHNGTTTTMTEYAVLETNGVLATFSSDVNTGNARLLVTMGSATAATINITKSAIVV